MSVASTRALSSHLAKARFRAAGAFSADLATKVRLGARAAGGCAGLEAKPRFESAWLFFLSFFCSSFLSTHRPTISTIVSSSLSPHTFCSHLHTLTPHARLHSHHTHTTQLHTTCKHSSFLCPRSEPSLSLYFLSLSLSFSPLSPFPTLTQLVVSLVPSPSFSTALPVDHKSHSTFPSLAVVVRLYRRRLHLLVVVAPDTC